MGWLKDRFRGVVDRWAEEAIAIGLLAAVYFLWRHRDAKITIEFDAPVWALLILFVTAVSVALLLTRTFRSIRSGADSQVRSSEQRRRGVYFEIVSGSGGFRLNVVKKSANSANNEIMLQSEVYPSMAAAKNAIEELQLGGATVSVKEA